MRTAAAKAIAGTVAFCGIMLDPDGPELITQIHEEVSTALQTTARSKP